MGIEETNHEIPLPENYPLLLQLVGSYSKLSKKAQKLENRTRKAKSIAKLGATRTKKYALRRWDGQS